MNAQWQWLLIEGLIPLFGASAIYLLWGICTVITDDATPRSKFSWKEAIDSAGWLYVTLILAIQSAMRSWSAISQPSLLGYGCVFCAIVCLMLLLNAMAKRGVKPDWKPPVSLQVTSLALVVAVLLAGFRVHGVDAPSNPQQAQDGKAGLAPAAAILEEKR